MLRSQPQEDNNISILQPENNRLQKGPEHGVLNITTKNKILWYIYKLPLNSISRGLYNMIAGVGLW